MRNLKRICFSLFTLSMLGLAFPTFALAAPDLIPGAASATTLPATAVTGTNILTAVITNQGDVSTGVGFSNFFQVASAADGGGTITDLPPTSMPALAAGASNNAYQEYSFPAAGTYSFRVCADETSSAGGGVINEGTNEGNNCGGGTGGGGWQNVSITGSWGSPDTPVMTSASCSSGTATLSWGAIPGTPSYLAVLKVPSGTSCPTGWGPWIQANTCVSPPTSASTGKFTIGQQVATIGAANVRQTPGGTLVGSQPAAAVATVVNGPTSAAISGSGDPTLYSWWDLNFNSGVDGWVADDNLTTYTSTTTPLVLPTTMTITGLPTQTGYEAFAYAYQNNEGVSSESNHIAFSCSGSAATPAAPVLSSASCTSGAATLSWGAVTGADSYVPILRLPSTDTSCPAGWSPVVDMGSGASFENNVLYCTTAPSGTSVSLSGLTSSEGYGAFVYAKKSGLWSSDSNHIGFTCSPSPAAPVPPGLKGQAACWAPGDMGVPVQWDLCSQSKGNSVQIAVDTADAPETQWGYMNTSDCAGTNPWPGFIPPDDSGGYYVIARSPFNGTQYQKVFIPHPAASCSGMSDLTVDAPIAVSPAPSVGTPTTFTATVRNIGTFATEGNGFYTLFQSATGLDGSGNGVGVTDLAVSKVPTLAAKPKSSFWSSLLAAVYLNGSIASSATAQIKDNYTFTSPGTYYVRACADKSSASDAGIIDETNENNNCSSPWTSVIVTATCPTAGQICNSGLNSCQMYNTGTYNNDAGCTCSATTPDNSLCSGVTPAVVLKAPQRIRMGQAATLSWSAQGVTSCTLSGPLVQNGSNVNSITVNADAGNAIAATTTTSQLLQSQTTFNLSCTKVAGPNVSVQTIVNLLPQAIEN